MDKKQNSKEKHTKKIIKKVTFAQSNLPFYGRIVLQDDHGLNIGHNSVPGLFVAISTNETNVYAAIEDGNLTIGLKNYKVPIQKIKEIEVEKDSNFKIIFDPKFT